MFKKIICGIALLSVSSACIAQDRRTVTQPKIPAICISLSANKFVGDDRKIADTDEKKLDTERIQEAINNCPYGKAVELKNNNQNNAFLTGPLHLRNGITLLIQKNITLYASRNPDDYNYPHSTIPCATLESADRPFGQSNSDPAPKNSMAGCRPLISIDNVKNAAVMGKGVIDGRGDMQLIGRDYSWWQLARKAEPGNKKYYSMRLIVAKYADGLILYGISLHNSPNFHVTVNNTEGFTAWDVHLKTPTVAGTDARNTDGIDPGSSTNVTIAHSWIENDDDNVAIKTGITYMSVLHNHFYNGHGMSIGSETTTGVSNLLVDDLVEDHTTSGIRIKSNVTRGGLVHDLTYQNICMRDVKVPIAVSPYYNNGTTDPFIDPGFSGDKIPDYKFILLRNMTAATNGDVLIAGADEQHRTSITLDNVQITGITAQQVHLKLADIQYNNTNIPLDASAKENQVTLTHLAKTSIKSYACDGKFLPMQ